MLIRTGVSGEATRRGGRQSDSSHNDECAAAWLLFASKRVRKPQSQAFCRSTEECTCVIAYCKIGESWAAEKEDAGRALMGKVLSNIVS